MDEQQYLKERLDDQISWYSRKSKANKNRYYALSILQILCGVSIPFLAGLEAVVEYKTISSFLGLTIAIITGLFGVFKFQENWTNYRTTAETLKHEKYKFLTNASPYDFEDSFKLFVINIEGLISKENSNWQAHTKKTSKKK